MRVLRVVGGLDAEFGGPPSVTANSVVAASLANIQTTVVFPHRDMSRALEEPAARSLLAAGIECRPFPMNQRFKEFNRTRGVSTSLVRWLWRQAGDYDVIHVESPWGLHCLAAVAAAKRHGKPIVLMPHECFTKFDLSHAHSPILRGLKHVLLPLYRWTFDTVIFSSSLERRDSPGAWRGRRAAIIHHPVVITESAEGTSDVEETKPHFVVGYLGRFHPKKNIELLIEALALLPQEVSLRLAGTGDSDYYTQLKKRVEAAGMVNRVTWCGFLSGAKKDLFLREIDLLAMPSRYECFGMVAAEAMAAGTPTLVTRECGVAESIKAAGAGMVVAPTSGSLAIAVRTLIKDPSVQEQMAQRCVGAAQRDFSMEAHGHALARLYNDLCPALLPSATACQVS